MDFPGYKVLIVDDEEMIRKLLVSLLSKQGVSCETATDGLEAMNKIETETFDAVITDIEMPGMDGITLTKAISSRYPNLQLIGSISSDSCEFATRSGKALNHVEWSER